METIAQDLQQVMGNPGKGDSILAALGMDIDSSFKHPKSHQIYNDPYHITQGELSAG
jgi:hypothetical protein